MAATDRLHDMAGLSGRFRLQVPPLGPLGLVLSPANVALAANGGQVATRPTRPRESIESNGVQLAVWSPLVQHARERVLKVTELSLQFGRHPSNTPEREY